MGTSSVTRRSIESVVLLFVAVALGSVAWHLSTTVAVDSGVAVVALTDPTPRAATATALVGGVLVGLHVDDLSDAAAAAAVGVGCGFVVATLLVVGTVLVVHGTYVDGPLEPLRDRGGQLAVTWIQAVVAGTVAAVAASRL